MRLPLAIALMGLAGAAHADPCKGELPPPGAQFRGEVRWVVDGDGICVGDNPDPKTWIEVRLADFNARELMKPGGPEAKEALSLIAMGKRAECVAGRISYDRTVAKCTIGGRTLRSLMLEKGVPEGGR